MIFDFKIKDIGILGILLLLISSLFLSCNQEYDYTPKPRIYPKVIYPEKKYQPFQSDYCNFSFEFPIYTQIEKDTQYFDGKPKHECWFDIVYPDFNGRIHCSYLPIETDTSFEKFVGDAFNLAQEHTIKADYIDEYPVSKENNVSGFVFDIDGPAASPFQFFLTDSTQHFLRGSIYIEAQSQPDSLAPIVEFMKIDASHLINTFEWNK